MSKTFIIEPVTGNSQSSCKVYANGRQQCQILVRVNMGQTLTDAERKSIKLVAYGTGTDYDKLSLPSGMTTSARNSYDPHPDNTVSVASAAAVEAETRNEADELFTFYLSSSVVQSAQIMAVIRLTDGTVYTTHYTDSSTSFESSVTVVAETPLKVPASDLAQVGTADRSSSELDSYVWDLRNDLRIFERAIEVNGTWKTATHNSFYQNGFKGGINEITEAIASSKASGTFSFPAGRSVSYDCTESQFAAAAGHVKDASISKTEVETEYDHLQKVRLLDNFGTYQTYSLRGDTVDDRIGKIYIS